MRSAHGFCPSGYRAGHQAGSCFSIRTCRNGFLDQAGACHLVLSWNILVTALRPCIPSSYIKCARRPAQSSTDLGCSSFFREYGSHQSCEMREYLAPLREIDFTFNNLKVLPTSTRVRQNVEIHSVTAHRPKYETALIYVSEATCARMSVAPRVQLADGSHLEVGTPMICRRTLVLLLNVNVTSVQ